MGGCEKKGKLQFPNTSSNWHSIRDSVAASLTSGKATCDLSWLRAEALLGPFWHISGVSWRSRHRGYREILYLVTGVSLGGAPPSLKVLAPSSQGVIWLLSTYQPWGTRGLLAHLLAETDSTFHTCISRGTLQRDLIHSQLYAPGLLAPIKASPTPSKYCLEIIPVSYG